MKMVGEVTRTELLSIVQRIAVLGTVSIHGFDSVSKLENCSNLGQDILWILKREKDNQVEKGTVPR